jgi:diguanylate cyclase (GGDEF)-like protein
MATGISRLIRRFSIQHLIGATVTVGLISLALASTLVVSRNTVEALHGRLVQEGIQMAESIEELTNFALRAGSLTAGSEEYGKLENMLELPDVAAIEVRNFDDREAAFAGTGSGFAEAGARLERTVEARMLGKATQYSEDAAFLEVLTPIVSVEQDPLQQEPPREVVEGYVRLLISKNALDAMEREIFRSNLLVAGTITGLLLLALLALTNRIVVPLRDLARSMQRAEQGEQDVRAELKGTRDVIEMEQAFNTMMNVLESREQALKTARDQALESARAKANFAATVSHELRTPLNAVIGMLELISEMDMNTQQRDYVRTARNSADMLLDLIDDILTFSKNDAGKTSLEVREFALRDGIEEIVTLVAAQAHGKGLEIAAVIDEDVPPVLMGDFDRLRQVLLNLLGNAVKFTQQGEVSLNIHLLENDSDRAVLQFEVIDTGIGIDPSAQQRIFDAFSQEDGSTTRRFGGTGLGLAISRQLTQLMGGEIGVDSTPGDGSRFHLQLPLLKPQRGGATGLRSVLPLPRLASVLLCDDTPLVQRAVQSLLTGEQVRLHVAGSSEEAARRIRAAAAAEEPFDVVLLDDSLRNGRGDDDSESIVSLLDDQDSSLVLLTHGSPTLHGKSRSRQAIPTLAKPLRKAALMDCLKLLLTDSQGPVRELHRRRPGSTPLDDFENIRVLVVEDNRANQDVARGMLERLGCQVLMAADGIACLETLRDQAVDLILMDCQMPRMDGFEATRRIRGLGNDHAELPIVAMTANVQKGAVDSCLAAGMNDYLAKPVRLGALKTMLGRWLAGDESAPDESTEPPQDGDSVIDREFIDGLAAQLGREATVRLLETVSEDLPRDLQTIADAAAARELDALVENAHRLKGSAMNVGAGRLTDSLQRLEGVARSADVAQLDRLLDDVQYEAGLLQRVLDARVVGPSSRTGTEDKDGAAAAPARILVADDDRGSRFALREVLLAGGHEIIEAENGQQALVRCREQLPDLILLDARMPVMDGFTACQLIRKLPEAEAVQILMITGLDDEESITRAFDAGANDYISKPVNFAVLRKRVDRLLQASHSERHVRELAYVDALTGLPNRAQFNEHIHRMLNSSTREDSPFALLLLDLDGFKLVNDSMGHEAGDLLLKYFADRIQGCLRKGDMVARFGGDEFCVILDRIKSRDLVESIADKIHDHLSRPFVFMKKEMFITTSIGIAIYPEHGGDVSTLLRNADMAMYRAKEQGNQYRIYQEQFESAVVHRMEMQSDLRAALDRDELLVHFQPQQDLRTGAISGMEALVRWNHPGKGMVSPVEFIYLAEETGMIMEIGHWVLCHCCEQLARWIDAGYEAPRIAINLSARQLKDPELTRMIAEVLEETGVPAGLLEFEITESTIMENPEDVNATLHQLKDMGFLLAIDDFGTGYSSLNYLKRFPIDYIKIDRVFITDVVDNRIDADIVRAIVALARALNLKVIAEGVETESQLRFLGELDCDYAQGYLLSRPAPAAAMERDFMEINRDSKLVPFPSA